MTPPRESQLFLHLSNRFESLADALAADLAGEQGDPLGSTAVVVSSAETARWLSMRIAERTGLAMGLRYPFPRGVIDELMSSLLGSGRRCSPGFGRDAMMWWAYDVLPRHLDHPAFDPVRNYLRDGSPLRRFELARRIASLLDQYQIYRPELLRSWDDGADPADWQAQLWRALRKTLGGEESFVDLHAAVGTLTENEISLSSLPARLRIFGLSTIPPAFLDVLWKASISTRIDLYALSPTEHYWSDLPTLKQRLRAGDLRAPADGNPLALSLGRLGREMIEQLIERDFQQASEFFEPAAANRLLNHLQNDFLEMRDGGQGSIKTKIDEDDASICIHSCHGHMREVEILHDHLLALFEDDRSLRPRHVLVMAPDIDTYAPYIAAVFGSPESDATRIPWSLADQSCRRRFVVADTLLRVLELGVSRFETTRLLAVLECEPIRRNFALNDADLQRIRRWIAETGVVWGLDAAHKETFGFPAVQDHTWERTASTLLAGLALDGCGPRMYGELLPFSDLEGESLDTLERFLIALDHLRSIATQLQAPRLRADWSPLLCEIIQGLFGNTSTLATELHAVQTVIADLLDHVTSLEQQTLDAEVVIASLDHCLRDLPGGGGFLDGRVTFCSLKPMRAIPTRVICLLGMNDGEYPRQNPRLAFDRMVTAPRRGDRSLREDDRHLFFETLLAARDRIYISHRGLSHRDTTDCPPSSVVIELADYLTRAFDLPASVEARLAVKHPLQAFSPRNFERLGGSFSRANAAAAALLEGARPPRRDLFIEPLPAPPDDWRIVSPQRLAQFFSHPMRRLLEWRLGISPAHTKELPLEHEPLKLDNLSAYDLRQAMTESALRAEIRPHWEAAQAKGRVPSGLLGEAIGHDLTRAVDIFVDEVRRTIGTAERHSIQILREFGPWRIEGVIDSLYDGKLCRFRCASLKAKDQISAWILHVILNVAVPSTQTLLIDRDGRRVRFEPPNSADTEKLVCELFELFWRGLQSPLPLFPATSLAFVEAQAENKDPVAAAEKAWFGNPHSHSPGEVDDAWNILGTVDGLPWESPEFANVARCVLGPLLRHRLEEST